ncbi:MAG: HU family DNA-binding protein, partial [Muribaculaceae bacterium]|nr:HU family DNA-binding protein [Muribaculaceae bacterium]
MNNTIALPHLAEILAKTANVNREEAEKFIKAFFSHIEDALAVSENVTIKGLGTFTRTSEAEQPIVFTIDPELAAAVKQPFEMFDP